MMHFRCMLFAAALIAAVAFNAPSRSETGSAQTNPQKYRAPTAQRVKPNILLVIADDFGVDMLASYGEGTAPPPTPNLDALRSRGVLFRNCWGNPVCSAARACILTGRYGFRTGVGWVMDETIQFPRVHETSIANAINNNPSRGYSHALFGKWHLANDYNGGDNSPNAPFGFSRFSGFIDGEFIAPSDYYTWPKTIDGVTNPVMNYATTDNVDDAKDWIDSQNGPWFTWLAFNAPHSPLHLPPLDLHSYDTLPGTAADIAAHPRAYYNAMVEAMDTEFGRLWNSLSAATQANTYVIFIGDNGSTGEVTLPPFRSTRAKGTLYQGGIRVPLLISGPGVVSPNREVSELVNGVDLFATILGLAGIDAAASVPAGTTLDSVSLIPYLTSSSASAQRSWVYSEAFGDSLSASVAGRAIRGSRYKLIVFADGTERFYDLHSDPYETTNIPSGSRTLTQIIVYNGLVAQLAELTP